MPDLLDRLTSGLTPPKSLRHYGVKGMKWGVRKRRSGRVSQETKTESDGSSKQVIVNRKTKRMADVAKDHLDTVAVKSHVNEFSLASVSNKDLQTAITRLNLEANYRKAMAANTPPPHPLKQWLKSFGSSEAKKFASGKPTTTEDLLSIIKMSNSAFKVATGPGSTGTKAVKAIGAGVQASRAAKSDKKKK